MNRLDYNGKKEEHEAGERTSVCIAHPTSAENPDVRFCFLQDLMNRKIVMKMVLELAMLPDQKNRQFIFLTPLDLRYVLLVIEMTLLHVAHSCHSRYQVDRQDKHGRFPSLPNVQDYFRGSIQHSLTLQYICTAGYPNSYYETNNNLLIWNR